MKDVLFMFDAGHGGLHPDSGKYQTAGKRSPRFEDGKVLFEGVNNRDNVQRILKAMDEAGLEAIDIVNDWKDVPLNERVRRANELARTRECMFISIHSNGAGNGREWHSAKGNEIFVSENASQKSKDFAKILGDDMICNFEHLTNWRGVKTANFYVIRKTNCPAVLVEFGFHTNKEECLNMISIAWKNAVVKSVVDACKTYTLQ
jgi:N-acetylmuramoyl-L-alanine amidase